MRFGLLLHIVLYKRDAVLYDVKTYSIATRVYIYIYIYIYVCVKETEDSSKSLSFSKNEWNSLFFSWIC